MVTAMTALEYMEKQLQKHRNNYDCELLRGVPEEMLQNIGRKVGYYEAAVDALKMSAYVEVTRYFGKQAAETLEKLKAEEAEHDKA